MKLRTNRFQAAVLTFASIITLVSTGHAQWTGLGAGGAATDISDAANYVNGADDLGNLSSITVGCHYPRRTHQLHHHCWRTQYGLRLLSRY